ncbi:MAG TPA: ribosome-associated translation inhibitor RaiA [Terriglobia bacterium]|nr:ribosome-associated translation inhibitor RaiA [Terriglobia bacterium]
MKVDITGRHIEVTEPLRKFATDRLERLRGGADGVMEAHLTLSVEKHQRHLAEIHVKTRHETHNAHEVSTDMYTSIAAAIDKLEKQLLRSKGRTESRKRRGQSIGVIASSAIEAAADLGEEIPQIVRTHQVAAKPLTLDEAALECDASAAVFLVFRNAETQRLNVVYKRNDGNIGWIDPEA